MSFESPLMLLGLLAVAAPIIIHLINRSRAARVRFPALEFLARSNRKLARRLKLKQLALLAMRISFFLLLPLAMARPSLFCSGEATPGGSDGRLPASVVFVIDDSGSMSAPGEGGTLYTEAVAHVQSAVRDLRSWDEAALVFTAATPLSLVGELTADRADVLRPLGEHVPRFSGSDIRGGLAVARDIQQTSRQPVRRTILITDGTGAGWPSTVDQAPLAGLGELSVIRVGPAAPANVAVSDIRYSRAQSGAAGEYAVEATIRAWGGAEREVSVQLEVDGVPVASTPVPVANGREEVATFVHRFDGNGPFEVRARIEGDTGASIDDSRALPLQPDRAVRTLLVNGDARSVALNDEVFFLRRALELVIGDAREIEPSVTSPEEFVGIDLALFDVVVLANVAALPVPQVTRLQTFVEQGGGLWMSAGDNADAERWNSIFAPLLPKLVRSVKVLATRGQSEASIQATRIGEIDVLHPAARVFALRGGESIRSALVYRYLLLEPSADSPAEVIASFADGGPALLEHAVGRGRVMLWTSSLDDGWTDLPLATTYVPLVRRIVQYLARRGGGSEEQAEIGRRVTLPVGSLRPERVSITTPSGARTVLEPQGDGVSFVPPVPGFYGVSVTVAGEDVPVPEFDFAANSDRAEHDPARVDAALVAAIIDGSVAEARTGNELASVEGRNLWPLLLFLALCALYAETLLAVRRRLWVRLGAWLRGGRRESAI